MYLALHNDLIGATLVCEEGTYLVLDFIDYDSMTKLFSVEVQNVDTKVTSIREMSDRLKYEIVGYAARRYLNDKMLKPRT